MKKQRTKNCFPNTSRNDRLDFRTSPHTENSSIIFHVDMDHFFTAIEEREHPQYRGNPLIVGANPNKGYGRGVVSTCNYQARKFGLMSGMPISKAWRLCPQAVFVPPNFQLYRQISAQIMEILQSHSKHCEPYGIDEAFLDMTDTIEVFSYAKNYAQSIKHDILSKTQLTCSIGVAPTKLIAKMASEFCKPDGLQTVNDTEVIKFISPLSVRKLWGIGKQTQKKLNLLDIHTIQDLMNHEPTILHSVIGAKARYFYRTLYGTPPHRQEQPKRGRSRKSISKEHTFSENTRDQNAIFTVINTLSKKIHAKAQKRHLWFKTITLKIRYDNFETHTYSTTLRFYTNHLKKLCSEAHHLRQRHLILDKNIRLIGVKISNIQHVTGQQTLPLLSSSPKI